MFTISNLDWRDYLAGPNDNDMVYLIFVCSQFFWYAFLELLEKKLGMEPQIYSSSKINKLVKIIEKKYNNNKFDNDTKSLGDITINDGNESNDDLSISKPSLPVPPLEQVQTTSVSNISVPISKAPVEPQLKSGIVSAEMVDESIQNRQKSFLEKVDNEDNMMRALSAEHIQKRLHNDSHVMPKRLTKSLDNKGRYRVSIRKSVQVIKFTWCFILNVFIIVIMFLYPDWWYRHCWVLDKDTSTFIFMRIPFIYLVAYYLFELAINRYAKIDTSMLAHHITAIIAVTRYVFRSCVCTSMQY